MFSFHHRPLATALPLLALLLVLLPAPPPAAAQEEEKLDPDRGLPLEPARWARFTTNEGTWISLDVSPDGETIVFDLLGDLYRMPIAGGEATRLTSGLPHDMQPRFSPDGTRIVYVSDRSGDENVWLIDADGGEPTQLSKGVGSVFLSPEWMPDGKYVVVSRSRAFFGLEKLWLYHVDGGTGLEMVGGGGAQRMLGAAVDAEGRYIWYAAAPGHLAVQRDLPAVPALGLRPPDRDPHADDEPLRLGLPPRPLTGWGTARLRHPRGHRDGDPAPRTRLGG